MAIIKIPNTDIPQGLRNIADGIDSGDLEGTDCTIIFGTDVFHLGPVSDEKAAVDAIWNMTYGIHKMMAATNEPQ